MFYFELPPPVVGEVPIPRPPSQDGTWREPSPDGHRSCEERGGRGRESPARGWCRDRVWDLSLRVMSGLLRVRRLGCHPWTVVDGT